MEKKDQKSPKIVQKPSQTLPENLPKEIQNDILSCNPRKSQIMQPSHVFAHFWRSQALEKRAKIEAKTP